ncbi:glutamate/gamma-aminobutyrate family transporter YjeM [Levilactobacillus bambusae]|uniref:Glutamate/gamma-aminobutyrate family transporter YjeM n=1 Tax=Levilactobacillus bambusae TaxID=2024736 RepID=A0A2V1N0X3_9LACO|nr:glutamate/gamma-aminobutyrate family transporter YjeM [Levilactobacillus bambusae]PWG00887.1 glutamate/gamma-aminobutyrate family transporter YjeM [Levilactobacillus bambusae]
MEKKEKIGLVGLILMIFSAIFGFANTTVAYDQMGYAAIMWYVLAALLFFFPSAMMLAEYGASFKEAKGGIYSWLAGSISEKWAFIGTFIWLSSWIVWMVSTASKIWIPFSTTISGTDKTGTWSIFGLTSTQTVGLLGIILFLIITYFATRGMDSIKRIASVGGVFTMLLFAAFILASLVILFIHGGRLAEPIQGASSFVQSPNGAFSSPIAVMSFVVYAIFAYAGMESMGGVVDSVDNPSKTFPRAVIIASLIMAGLYSISIFMWGISTNWHQILGGNNVNLGNITYVLMNNLGYELGKGLGLTTAVSIQCGMWLARFTGLSMFLGYLGSFFVLIYSPLKSFIMGSNPSLWPKKMTKLNKAGMPAYAMWIQAIIVCLFVFFISFGGANAQTFYLILTDMANICTCFPYVFLIGGFPFFKHRTDLERPFVFYKTKASTYIVTGICMTVLILGMGFTALEPILEGDYQTAFWTIFGPVFFGIVAWIFYKWSGRHSAHTVIEVNEK